MYIQTVILGEEGAFQSITTKEEWKQRGCQQGEKKVRSLNPDSSARRKEGHPVTQQISTQEPSSKKENKRVGVLKYRESGEKERRTR